ncbi:hypothetical protein XBJ2_1860066 [Xenorhabdus bovienii str. Jollieti]|uniref:Uncharacterized protein n=1 Tax=Xenorhabdus bovienii (strain SS-2004) TaxID=406818 RepID=D3V551_XENBS|nr:hypothetical protein XBJ1_3662 [Xenorhabdus bovienii SS-2004]CDH28563.1 hypothetical protein XBJ2_1860066 [Xenorhabdus bovienii str. Jollieti]
MTPQSRGVTLGKHACGLFQDLIGVNKYVSSTHLIKSSPFLLNYRAAPCFCATRRKPTIE